MDDARLKRAFLEESEEMVGELNRRLVELEKDKGGETVNEVFRLYHSLKSEAALMNYSRLAELAHRVEDVFDLVKRGDVTLSREVMDAVFAATDLIHGILSRVAAGGGDTEMDIDAVVAGLESSTGRTVSRRADYRAMPKEARAEIDVEQKVELGRADRLALEESRERRERLYRVNCWLDEACPMKFVRAYLILSNLESSSNVIKTIPSLEQTGDSEVDDDAYRRLVAYVTTSEPEPVLAQALEVDELRRFELVELDYDDLLGPQSSESPRTAGPELPALEHRRRANPERASIRVETRKLDDIWGLVGQLVITKGRLGRLQERAPAVETSDDVEQVADALGVIVDGLQRAMMETRMVSVAVIFDKLPRLIRDLSKQIGKEAELEVHGEGTEIDRSFVEALSDPLTHLIRNCLDHGLESPEERIRSGKVERGTITASAFQEGGKVVIEVADDGRGLDLKRIRLKAEKLGLLRAGESRRDAELVELIFRPGFSTAESVTDISGRGVGMDVVATRVREVLRGEVLVRTEPGRGTRFSIVLPLTLTIMHTLVVGLGGRHYAIPVRNVDETARLDESDIRLNGDGTARAAHRGGDIPVYFLAGLLGVAHTSAEAYDAVIVTHRGRKAYLVVDQLVEELDVVIKPIDDLLNPLRLYSGVSVLGDGRILLVLSTTFIGD